MNNNRNNKQFLKNNNYRKVIDYVYSTIELSRYNYKIIEYEEDLTVLTKQKHYLSANLSGNNCLLVFIKLKDKYYSVLINRKTLTYNKNQLKMNNVKIIPVNIRLDNSIYNGSIFDGIYVRNKTSRTNIFIITDVYYFLGKDMSNDNIKHKFKNITVYLENNYKIDPSLNSLKLSINNLYEPTDLRKLNSDIEKTKGFDFKGFVFFPEISGTKLIFLNNNSNNKMNKTVNKIPNTNTCNKNSTKSCEYKYISKTNNDIIETLEIRKTDSPDVYIVLCAENKLINNRKRLGLKKLGIALIPDIPCSTMCREVFEKKVNNRALMKCKFDNSKNKWIPLEEDKKSKLPALITKLEEKLERVVID